MGRKNRGHVLFDNCWAHVISRAADKRYILEDAEDFEKFKNLLQQSKINSGFKIHHYCLMNTHFHLVVSMKSVKDFSEGLKWVKWSYAKYFNFKVQRFGPLWRDRFKSLVIEDERYLAACGSYIEGNPVEAGMVSKNTEWPYSSSRHYELGQVDNLIDGYAVSREPVNIPENKENFFSEGHVIGSNLFKIHCEEQAFQSMPVPV